MQAETKEAALKAYGLFIASFMMLNP